MRGMTIQEFTQVVDFVQKHHKFAQWHSDEERAKEVAEYPKIPEYGFNIKYVDSEFGSPDNIVNVGSVYDSRDKTFWLVKFRGMGNNLAFSVNHFNSWTNPQPAYFKYDNLFDWVMDYLKGEWHNNQILKDCAFEIKK